MPVRPMPRRQASQVMSDVKIVRMVGGLEVSALVKDGPRYRGTRERTIDGGKGFTSELDTFLVPYQGKAQMNRHDAAMVCGALTQLLKGADIEVVKPFTVSPPEKSAPSPPAA